jgi:hypothetical protein
MQETESKIKQTLFLTIGSQSRKCFDKGLFLLPNMPADILFRSLESLSGRDERNRQTDKQINRQTDKERNEKTI